MKNRVCTSRPYAALAAALSVAAFSTATPALAQSAPSVTPLSADISPTKKADSREEDKSLASLSLASASASADAQADQQPAGGTKGTAGPAPGAQGSGLAVQINNPVTDLWLIEMEFNNFKLEKDPIIPLSGKWVHNFYLQPVMPVKLTEDLSLISRPVIPIYQSVPYPTGPTTTNRKTAFGDIVLAQVLSPKLPDPWIVAAGPTWIFPTAGSRLTGQGKLQLGPAIGGGVVTKNYIAAALIQQWWSIAGKDSRANTSQMAILPKVYAFWGDGWSVGYSGQIQVDWKAQHGDKWTVPAGLALGKVVKFGILPVQLRAGVQAFPIRPDFGPKWNFSLQITPIIPRLIQKPLFD